MSHRRTDLLIEDIWESLLKIERYVSGLTREAFVSDDKTIDSVVRNLEIIGEAANRLPAEFTSAHPQIAWTQIVGMRHRIVHEYFGVDLEIVWQVLEDDLPRLKEYLADLRRASGG